MVKGKISQSYFIISVWEQDTYVIILEIPSLILLFFTKTVREINLKCFMFWFDGCKSSSYSWSRIYLQFCIFHSVFNSKNFIKNQNSIIAYIGSEKRKKIELYVRLIFWGLHNTSINKFYHTLLFFSSTLVPTRHASTDSWSV